MRLKINDSTIHYALKCMSREKSDSSFASDRHRPIYTAENLETLYISLMLKFYKQAINTVLAEK